MVYTPEEPGFTDWTTVTVSVQSVSHYKVLKRSNYQCLSTTAFESLSTPQHLSDSFSGCVKIVNTGPACQHHQRSCWKLGFRDFIFTPYFCSLPVSMRGICVMWKGQNKMGCCFSSDEDKESGVNWRYFSKWCMLKTRWSVSFVDAKLG